jgi:peptidoglycan/xylan/chitin deacetylase (PgdA/CDA1 family)
MKHCSRRLSFKKFILNGFSQVPVFEVLYRANKNKGIILVYHQVKNPISFEKQIAFISRSYQVIPVEELVALVVGGKQLPEHSLSITFDDGFRNVYENVYPVLIKYKCPATVFLNTGFVGTNKPIWPQWVHEYIFQSKESSLHFRSENVNLSLNISRSKERTRAYRKLISLFKHELQADLWHNLDKLWEVVGKPEVRWDKEDLMLNWDQVRDMEASGWVRFGNHTDMHRILPWIDFSSLEAEIDHADVILNSRLSSRSPVFAYPNGEYDDRAARLLREKGYLGAVTTQERFIMNHSDPMRLERIGANDDEGIPILKFRLCGEMLAIKLIYKTIRIPIILGNMLKKSNW